MQIKFLMLVDFLMCVLVGLRFFFSLKQTIASLTLATKTLG